MMHNAATLFKFFSVRRFSRPVAFLAVLVSLSSCSTYLGFNPSYNADTPIVLSFDPVNPTVAQGQSVQINLTITPINSFTGDVELSLIRQDGDPAPAGLTISPTRVTVSDGSSVTQIITLSVDSSVSSGVYGLRLTGNAGQGLIPGVYFALSVGENGEDTWSSSEDWLLYSVVYGGGAFVAVGDGIVLTSFDGADWTKQVSLTMGSLLQSVAYGNNTFVAVGDSGVAITSADGLNWISHSMEYTLADVAYGDGTFVAVGEGGTILTSPDGMVWTARHSGTSNYLYGVTYGDGAFVAVGDCGTVLTSPDGVSWTVQSSETSSCGDWPEDVAYGDGTFVAVGYGGAILTSPDGVSWTAQDSGVDNWLSGVAYGNGTFVAVGADTILTSFDGKSWAAQSAGYLYDVTYGDGLFVAVGCCGTILTSSDGANWVARSLRTGNGLEVSSTAKAP